MMNMYFVYYCLEEDAEWTSSNETFEVFLDYNKAVNFARDVRGKVYDAGVTVNGGFEVGTLIYDFTESPDLLFYLEDELKEDLASLETVDEDEEF